MTVPSRFAVFSTVFAIVYTVTYIVCVDRNYALFSYHPALNQFGPGVQQPLDGPVMYWYGWMATSTLVATSAAALACVLPRAVTTRVSSSLAWLVPTIVLAAFCYLLRE